MIYVVIKKEDKSELWGLTPIGAGTMLVENKYEQFTAVWRSGRLAAPDRMPVEVREVVQKAFVSGLHERILEEEGSTASCRIEGLRVLEL